MLDNVIDSLGGTQGLMFHGGLLLVNVLIIILSDPLLRVINKSKEVATQAKILRFAAGSILIFHIVEIFLQIFNFDVFPNLFRSLSFSIATIFACLITFNIVSYFSRKKFGIPREVDGETTFIDSYNSRLVDVVASILVVIIAIFCFIYIWKLNTLLEATGFLGIVFAFIALTNGVWFPDIYYGLVILNSKMLEDGDVIKIEGKRDEFIISRVSFIYTMLLDVRNNHRIIIRNHRLLNSQIDNLSKRASIDGIRHAIKFNIAYPIVDQVYPGGPGQTENLSAQGSQAAAPHVEQENNSQSDTNQNDKKTETKKNRNNKYPTLNSNYDVYRNRIRRMFEAANQIVLEDSEAKINPNQEFEVALTDSGNYALEFTLNFYIDALPNTKVTRTIRQYLVSTPSIVQEAVNEASVIHGIELATPQMIDYRKKHESNIEAT